MTDKSLVLLVDDEPINLEILDETLSGVYDLVFAASGEECIEKLKTLEPDLILLDVNMPKMTGIAVCKKLKENDETSGIPVVFVSALSLPEERMSGYQAGAEDYITKPFEEEELLVKIELILASQQEKKSLQKGSNDALTMAMTAMTQASEMGEVMQFTRDSYHCNTLEALATRLLSSFAQFELNATLRMSCEKGDFFFSSMGEVKLREQEIMEHVRDGDRFIHFGRRTIINFNNISVLIKNMPIEDLDKYGRLNDVTGMLVEGADARIVGIGMSSSLLMLINTTREVLAEIDIAHQMNEQSNTAILDDLENSIEWAFINIDLDDQQEAYFRELLNTAREKSSELFKADTELEQKITDLISLLSLSS